MRVLRRRIVLASLLFYGPAQAAPVGQKQMVSGGADGGTMRPRSMARKLEGTVFEMLGTAFSVGCTVNGEAPMDIMQQIKDGELEVPDE